MSTQTTPTWQTRAAQKHSQNQSLIPEAWKLPPTVTQDLVHPLETSRTNLIALDIPRRSGILTSQELRITEDYNVQHLLKALASGDLTALEVTTAFCKRAAIAQQLVCFVIATGACFCFLFSFLLFAFFSFSCFLVFFSSCSCF